MGQVDSYDELEIVETEETQLGRYRLVGELASGGMATVHLALETEGLGRLVALKTMHPHLSAEPDYVDMFLDEARINGAIDHPNVCKVFDFGQADGRYFIAMEQLSGHTLKGLIGRVRRQGRPEDYCSFVVQVVAAACDGLHAAHELRDHNDQPLDVVHRDVSPQNLYLGYDGRLRVVDFGIAHATGRIQHTSEGVVKGKFGYIAPEQIRSGDVDRRADVWSVGIVLWELLTLKRLFVRATHADTLMSVMMDPIKAPSELETDVPKELDEIVLRALSRDREVRFGSAREMAESLRRIVAQGVLPSRSEAEVAAWMQQLFPEEQAARREMMNGARELALEGDALGPLSVSLSAPTSARGPRKSSGVVPRVRTASEASVVRVRKASSKPPAWVAADVHGAAPEEALHPESPDSLLDAAPPQARRTRMSAAKWVVIVLCGGGAVAAALALPRQSAIDAAASYGASGQEDVATVASPLDPSPGAVVPAPSEEPPVTARSRAELTEAQSSPAPARSLPVSAGKTPRQGPPVEKAPSASPMGRVARPSQNRPARAKPRRGPAHPKSAAVDAPATPSAASEKASPAPEPSAPTEVTPARANEPAPNPFGGSAAADGANLAMPKRTPKADTGSGNPQASQLSQPREERGKTSAPKPASVPSPPPYVARNARVNVSNLQVQGPLSSSTVARMLARAEGGLERCYREASARAQRHDTRGLAAHFTIDEMGATRDVRVTSHPLPGLSSCASTSIKRLRSARRPDTGRAKASLKLNFELR